RITGSMRRAMDETERRRHKQLEYNAVHGITPRGIRKTVADIMEGARGAAPAPRGRRRAIAQGRAEAPAAPESLEPAAIARRIKRLESEMLERAHNLEFETAAQLRDEVARLKRLELGVA
ncbi:excinuclease ABC subunit B, partial [mine drainage metagenome]